MKKKVNPVPFVLLGCMIVSIALFFSCFVLVTHRASPC